MSEEKVKKIDWIKVERFIDVGLVVFYFIGSVLFMIRAGLKDDTNVFIFASLVLLLGNLLQMKLRK